MPTPKLKIKVPRPGGRFGNMDLESTTPGSNSDLHPKFSLRYLQVSSSYCLACCDKSQKAAFAEKIKDLSQLRWKDIYSSPKHGNGFEKIQQDSIKAAIPAECASRKFFISFRFDGKKPMVGFIEHDTFFVLWFDHNFTLYDHG